MECKIFGRDQQIKNNNKSPKHDTSLYGLNTK